MRKSFIYLAIFIALVLGLNKNLLAQEQPVLYFCEKYGDNGEVGTSDRFTPGSLTVMVKCNYPMDLDDVSIQFDKYNRRTGKFEYYKKFNYNIDPDMKYVYFSKNSDSDMSFDDPGFYRVFLLDEDGRTVTSGLVEIISR